MNLIPFLQGCITRTKPSDKDDTNGTRDSLDLGHSKNKYNKKLSFEEIYQAAEARRREHAKALAKREGSQENVISIRQLQSTDNSASEEDFDTYYDEYSDRQKTRAQWQKILRNNDLKNTSHAELGEALRHGIPEDLRPRVWAFIADVQGLKKQHDSYFYKKLKDTPSMNDKLIKRDIDRTFSDQEFFKKDKTGQNLLFNILRAYANYDKEIGYTQGMNFIVGALLLILDPQDYPGATNGDIDYEKFEEDVFWIFMHISFVKNYRVIYKTNFPKLTEMVKNLEDRVRTKTPEIYQHIKDNDLETFICFHQMFLSLMLIHTPIPIAKRILDLFLIEEEKILFKVIIRALNICKREILAMEEPEDLRNFLNMKMMEACYEKYKHKLYVLFPAPESTD